MFDSYNRIGGSYIPYPYEKTIIEKKAPTDDSIRLYEEIKEKAYKSIIDTIKIDDNILKVNAIVYQDALSYNRICKYRLLLNNNEIEGEIVIDNVEFISYDRIQIMKRIYEEVSKSISYEIIKLVFNGK